MTRHTTAELDDALTLLERTPRVLRSLLDGLPDDWVSCDEGPDTFSPRDVVGHLIDCEEDDWVPRIRILLEHGEGKPFTPFDRFAFRDRLAGLGVDELLPMFESLRAGNLEVVRGLDLGPDDLARGGMHPELGAVTLSELLSTWTVHDLSHLAQISRVMCKRRRDAVGPWREYLPILDRP